MLRLKLLSVGSWFYNFLDAATDYSCWIIFYILFEALRGMDSMDALEMNLLIFFSFNSLVNYLNASIVASSFFFVSTRLRAQLSASIRSLFSMLNSLAMFSFPD